jgi:glutamyl-Q tRNA(Asp) synthetase
MYVGRFAPSPTGALHFGSLVAAVASYLDARSAGGRWLLRVEDLDRAREESGAASMILSQLERLGLHWDGDPLWQSRRGLHYRDALAELARRGLTYACGCSRKEIADSSIASDGARIYPGTCRDGLPPGRIARATRVRTDDEPIRFVDRVQGEIVQAVDLEVGDFVLARADGVVAYQLAVAVDDAAQGVTDVVRGADLLESTPRQIYLQRLLGFPEPRYAHVPVAVDSRGEKISKQTGAHPLQLARPGRELARALAFLGHEPPRGLANDELLEWARHSWRIERVPALRTVPASPSVARRAG